MTAKPVMAPPTSINRVMWAHPHYCGPDKYLVEPETRMSVCDPLPVEIDAALKDADDV